MMQPMALRTLPGRHCRHAAAAAPTRRQRFAQLRHISVKASAEAETVDNYGFRAVEELQEYERSGTMDFAGLNEIRAKYNMRRGIDGRVQLRDRKGSWYQLKLDNEVKGTILMRELKTGSVYALQTDKLEQLDLSDDYLLLLMFADGNWSETIEPIQLGDGEGRIETLSVAEQQFKDTVGMLRTLEQMAQEDEEPQQENFMRRGYTDDVGAGQEIEIDPRSVRPLN